MDKGYRQAQQDRFVLGDWADAAMVLDVDDDDGLDSNQLFLQWLMEQRPFRGGHRA